ncbi:MAG: hypothetical protein ACJASQ_001622 [Crocinitomicaceae bacterium]|jgi:hypothetical protein
MANPLHRSDTFPHENEELPFMRQYFMETDEGSYNLTVYLDTDEFVLTAPNGEKTDDTFLEMHKREELYGLYQEGVYEWLILIRDKVNKIKVKSGIVHETFKVDDLNYIIRICARTNEVWIEFPKYLRYFDANDTYLINPELPIIQNGELDVELRRLCKLHGLDLPPTPYKVGIGVTQK